MLSRNSCKVIRDISTGNAYILPVILDAVKIRYSSAVSINGNFQ